VEALQFLKPSLLIHRARAVPIALLWRVDRATFQTAEYANGGERQYRGCRPSKRLYLIIRVSAADAECTW